jgi:nucleoside permease NupC
LLGFIKRFFFVEYSLFSLNQVNPTLRILIILVFIGCITILAVDMTDLNNLISLAGIFAFILVAILMSVDPMKVKTNSFFYLVFDCFGFQKLPNLKINWHILIVGVQIQFLLGAFLLKVDFGYAFFRYLSDQVSRFLQYADEGATLVYGEKFLDHPFAFQVTSV